MNTVLEVRREIHSLIDIIPERNLYRLRPLLDALVDDDDILSAEEQELLIQCRKDRKEHPESFITLDELKQRLKDGTALQI